MATRVARRRATPFRVAPRSATEDTGEGWGSGGPGPAHYGQRPHKARVAPARQDERSGIPRASEQVVAQSVGGRDRPMPDALDQEIDLAAEAEVEGRIEEGGSEGECRGDLGDDRDADRQSDQRHHDEHQADLLSEPRRRRILQVGRWSEPGASMVR